MSARSLLEVRGVTRRFQGVEGAPGPEVLGGVDLSLGAAETLAIVGPSGSGKSTLLNVIGGLDAPTSGEVWLEGRDLTRLSADELARVRNTRIGFVFQLHHLLPQCGALENVLVPTLVASRAVRAQAVPRARELLARVGLGERTGHRPAQLSGGECQRVAVVRALILAPALLLADEPSGSLDAEAAEALGDLLLELNREEGVALVVVTHSAELAGRMSRVLRLSAGELQEA